MSEKLGKTVAHALRHAPELYGLVLDVDGSVEVEVLAVKLSEKFQKPVTPAHIMQMVEEDSKGRYSLSEGRVRAVQGHSFPVELPLDPAIPPPRLYHGTTPEAWESIRKVGLESRQRAHIHLSADVDTAVMVASRRTKTPVILQVNARDAWNEGNYTFWEAENGVWLAGEHLPAEYITKMEK